jgi:hypothetical protein
MVRSGRFRRLHRLLIAGVAASLAVALVPSVANAQARPTAPACADVPPSEFTDVGVAGGQLERAVACVAAYGVTQGTTATTFSPGRTLNRGQLAIFMYRTLVLSGQVPPPAFLDAAPSPFADVPSGPTDLSRATKVLFGAGVIEGAGDGRYRPNDPVTRAQSTKIVALTLAAYQIPLPPSPPNAFTDSPATFRLWINQLAELGIVQGTGPTTFSPNASLTRGQMSYIVSRTLALLVQVGAVEPFEPDPVDPPPTTTTTTTTPTEPPPDTTAPALVGEITPPDGSEEVALRVQPAATFDESLSGTTSTGSLLCNGAIVPGAATVEGATITFVPAAFLAPISTCSITFDVADAAGNRTLVSSGFTTGADTVGPQLVSTAPAAGATGVGLSVSPSATFDEPLGLGSLGYLSCGGAVVGAATSISGATISLDPAGFLPYDTACSALFVAVDAAGNRTVTSVSFRTRPDTDPPVVVGATTPADEAVDVSVGTVISAGYNENLAPAATTVTVVCGDDNDNGNGNGETIEGATVTTGTTVTFTPTNDLPDDTTCTATITVADTAGNQTTTTITFTTEDITPPTLVSSIPSEGQSNVPVQVALIGAFDEFLGGGSTATVECDEIDQPGIATIVDDGPNVLQFVPSADLPDGTACAVTFTGVDLAGNTADPVTIGFTTVDLTPPALVGTDPGPGATDVPLDVVPSATFGEDLAAASTATLACGTPAAAVPGGVSIDGGTITFTPAAALPESTPCSATFIGVDASGNASDPVVVSFTTVDLTGPFLLVSAPVAGQSDVAVDAVLSASYDEILGSATATLVCGGTGIPGGTSASFDEVSFTPASALPGQTACTVTFDVEDLVGNPTTSIIDFTTADVDAPVLTGSDPADDASDVSVDLAAVTATFDETVVAPSGGTLSCGGDGVATDPSVAGNTVTLTVTGGPLPGETSCTATITAIDGAGNTGTHFVGFTTADVAPPQFVGSQPTDGDIGVPVAGSVAAWFSEPLDEGSSDVSLECGGDDVDGAVSLGQQFVADDLLTFTPAADLSEATTCTATFVAVDAAGNAAAPVEVTFTTVDVDPPFVVSTTATAGASTFTVTFNEPLDGDTATDASNYEVRLIESWGGWTWWTTDEVVWDPATPDQVTLSYSTITLDCTYGPVWMWWYARDVAGNSDWQNNYELLPSCPPDNGIIDGG